MDFVDIGLYIGYLLFFACAGFAIVWPLINSISEPKALVKSGIGVGAIILVFIISYAISGNETKAEFIAMGVDEGMSKTLGGILITMYILLFGSILAIIYTEIVKAFK
ncbi:MAG TPA: hypothetical protein PKC24_07995 [Cyclobacteriaceae bacterium]|nr:hypothetical protein [Cyclobacteriaceae bacterium]